MSGPAALARGAEHALERARRGDDGREVVLAEQSLLPGSEGGQHDDGDGEALFAERHRLLDVGDGEEGRARRQQPARHRQRAVAVGVRLHHRHDGDGHEPLQRP